MHRSIQRIVIGPAIALAAAMAFAQPSTAPTTAPSTAPTTAPRDWFGPAATPRAGRPAAPAATFATLYPRLAGADPALRAVTPRILFNGLGTKGVPPTLRLPKMDVVGNVFTDASQRAYARSNPKDPWLLVPDERRVKIEAVDAAGRNAAICLDVEALPVDLRIAGEAEVDRGVRTIAQMAGWVRAQDPSARLFLYATMPAGESGISRERYMAATVRPDNDAYQWWQNKRLETDRMYADWQAANDRLRAGPGRAVALADHFDGVCPSLYLHDWPKDPDPIATARAFAWLNIDEARRYGKPVYPFVWPRLYEKREPVDLRVWAALIREVMLHADGAILWDDPANSWDLPISLRVRVAMLLAAKRGEMTDRELYDALQQERFGGAELAELIAAPASTQPTPLPATQSSMTQSPAGPQQIQ